MPETETSLPLKDRVEAALKAGKKWYLRECSICNYPLTFSSSGGNLYFDTGCHCTGGQNLLLTDWSALDFYLNPEHGHIPALEKFANES